MDIIELVARWFVITIFLMGFIANTFGFKSVREEFSRWGIPQFIRVSTGVIEGVLAILLAFKIETANAACISSIVMASAIVIVVLNGELKKSILPGVVMVMAIITMYSNI